MDRALTQRIAFRLKRKFKRSAFSGLFRQPSRHNRAHIIPALQGIHRSNQAEPCSYRTRLEDHESTDGDQETGFQEGEDIQLGGYPPQFNALMVGHHRDLLAGSTITLRDTDQRQESDLLGRASTSSWTRVEREDTRFCSLPTSNLLGIHRRASIGSWTHVEPEDFGTCSIFRNRERAAPGEIRVLDSDLADAVGGITCGNLSSRRRSETPSIQSDIELRDGSRTWAARYLRPESVTPSNMASSVPLSLQKQPKHQGSPLKERALSHRLTSVETETEAWNDACCSAKELTESWEESVTLSDMASSNASSSQQRAEQWDNYLKGRGLSHMSGSSSTFRAGQQDYALFLGDELAESWVESVTPSDMASSLASSSRQEAEREQGFQGDHRMSHMFSTTEATSEEQGTARCSMCREDLTKVECKPTETCGSMPTTSPVPDNIASTVGESLWKAVCDAGETLQYGKYLPR